MIDFDYVYKTGPNAHKTVKQMFTQNISIDVEDCHFWQGKQFPNG